MKRPKIRKKYGPEFGIQTDAIKFLKNRGWYVERMIGNMLQSGIPDIYCYHKEFGERWVDFKNPSRYEFTKNQRLKWPIWERAGVGIWIMVGATEEEYDKLFKTPNMRTYWKKKYDNVLGQPTQNPRSRKAKGIEFGIQVDAIKLLKNRGWYVVRMIGNMFQIGIPDIYCYHKDFGSRWIDFKNPFEYEFTKAQKWKWPMWERAGIGIWIMVGATDEEYDKLFTPSNMRVYWKEKYNVDVDKLLDEI